MNRGLPGLLACILAFPWPAPALAWGDTGHRIICEIAFQELEPTARERVKAMIRRDPEFDTFAEACSWPDRPRRRAVEHYVNLPRDAEGFAQDPCPVADDCVVTAIEKDLAVLSSSSASEQDRLEALKYLGHWVGDVHQPLHVSFQDDRGGNNIFCVAAADDPVVPIVRRLIREHPEVPARLLVGGEGGGPNPKLDNLMKAWDVAGHDWIVLADSNVLIPPDYLDRLFARWTERCAFVCSPPVGIDVQGCAAELEAAFLNTFQARWQLAVDELGFGFVQGKTLLLRRSELAREGGLAALAREVAEDAAATKIARLRGREVHAADEPFPQPLGRRSLAGVWQRQLRWARLRRLSFPGFFCAELPAGGVFPFLLACSLTTGGVLSWESVAGMMLAWYGAEALLARAFGWPLRARSPLFWIARDFLLPFLWAHAWAAKSYEWRGNPVELQPPARAPCAPTDKRTIASRG